MCGIAGIIDLQGKREIDRSMLVAMADRLEHRGPDGHGYHVEPGYGFAHRRLAIIDIEGGKQPFTSSVGETVVTFNGEIYNFQEIASELEAKGRHLTTRSDTEVLAELIDIRGPDALSALNGMFAFASFSPRTGAFLLARDRLGEKPLYYGISAEGFLLFASELDALMASGGLPDLLDETSVADYLMYGYVPDPKSIYKNVYKLPPGHCLSFSRGGTVPAAQEWWAPTIMPDASMHYDDALEELSSLLDTVVSAQMIADVPVAGFLSGGVDSSAIVGAMSRHATGKVTTCSIGFDDPAHDERHYARQIADLFGTDHHEHTVQVDSTSLLPIIASIYNEPFADTSALPTTVLCSLARRHAKVALSGDGGDEIFAGYSRYAGIAKEDKLRRMLPRLLRVGIMGPMGDLYPAGNWVPPQFRYRTALQAIGEDTASGYARAVSAVLPDRARRMMPSVMAGYSPTAHIRDIIDAANVDDPILQAQSADLKTWLPGRMLVKVDRAAMASSLEVRPPLLDYRLVEWAAKLPRKFKMKDGLGKRIFKQSLESELPSEILYRDKQGFGSPVDRWFRDKNANLMMQLRNTDAWKDTGYFDVDHVLKLAEHHELSKQNNGQALWSVLMFDAFLTRKSYDKAQLAQAVM